MLKTTFYPIESETMQQSNRRKESIMQLQNLYADNIEYTNYVYAECKKAQKWLDDKVEYLESELKLKQEEINNLNEQLSKGFKDKIKDLKRKIKKIMATPK